jgi:tetratricopeptide (TPR) repeat protein
MSRVSNPIRVLGLACAVLLTPIVAQTPAAPPGGTVGSSVEQRVDEAVALTSSVKGTKGAERETALERAARAWEALLADVGQSNKAIGARAAWEAGELWRRRGDLESADDYYARCLALDEGRYRERATFERAHVARRQERFEDAIALYREVASMRPESARAHEARLRAGRCLEASGEDAEAISVYRVALEASSAVPRRALDAGNHLARALVRTGDLDAAAATIARVEGIAGPVLDAGGEEAARLRKALDGMSARRALQRARDARDEAGEDAERFTDDEARDS